ncbi:hypothetical protein cand_022250 [Cryptosporidium andersoni]|uniref:FAM13A-like domain-containing protein n=1 Tax=Cryptosporidium andersoni TaxID=117008 RepID=A0A1J4MRL3_9CRYT|nr:hypothetical protein cand_022250 [Cryptosporidium andersoni]
MDKENEIIDIITQYINDENFYNFNVADIQNDGNCPLKIIKRYQILKVGVANLKNNSTSNISGENSINPLEWLLRSLSLLNLPRNPQYYDFSHLSESELIELKRKVKKQLREFDITYQKKYGQLPKKSDKELLRPLYIYYRKLKQSIEAMNNIEFNKTSEKPDKDKKNIENDIDATCNHFDNISIITDNNETLNHGIAHNNISKEDLKIKVENLIKYKSKLRGVLEEYEKGFYKIHNRKVMYQKDLLPIEEKFIEYKAIKQKIKQIEHIINSDSNYSNK